MGRVRIYAPQVIDSKAPLIAQHERCHRRGQAIYDPVHYLPLVERKPRTLEDGALMQQLRGQGIPFYVAERSLFILPFPCELARALHAHLRLVAQPGGDVVQHLHPARHPARQFHQRQADDRQDRRVCQSPQQQIQALRLDGHGAIDPAKGSALMSKNCWDGKLVTMTSVSTIIHGRRQ